MNRYRTAFQVVLILGLGNMTVLAGAIRHSNEASLPPIGSLSLIETSERMSSGFAPLPLTLDRMKETASWAKLVETPLISTDLAAPSLIENLAQSSAPARPHLPVDPLLGAGSENMLNSGTLASNPEIASNSEFQHNIRIPEPASLTLLAAGVIGFAARRRLRKNLQVKKQKLSNS